MCNIQNHPRVTLELGSRVTLTNPVTYCKNYFRIVQTSIHNNHVQCSILKVNKRLKKLFYLSAFKLPDHLPRRRDPDLPGQKATSDSATKFRSETCSVEQNSADIVSINFLKSVYFDKTT
jgi:hypothetical protein